MNELNTSFDVMADMQYFFFTSCCIFVFVFAI